MPDSMCAISKRIQDALGRHVSVKPPDTTESDEIQCQLG